MQALLIIAVGEGSIEVKGEAARGKFQEHAKYYQTRERRALGVYQTMTLRVERKGLLEEHAKGWDAAQHSQGKARGGDHGQILKEQELPLCSPTRETPKEMGRAATEEKFGVGRGGMRTAIQRGEKIKVTVLQSRKGEADRKDVWVLSERERDLYAAGDTNILMGGHRNPGVRKEEEFLGVEAGNRGSNRKGEAQ